MYACLWCYGTDAWSQEGRAILFQILRTKYKQNHNTHHILNMFYVYYITYIKVLSYKYCNVCIVIPINALVC